MKLAPKILTSAVLCRLYERPTVRAMVSISFATAWPTIMGRSGRFFPIASVTTAFLIIGVTCRALLGTEYYGYCMLYTKYAWSKEWILPVHIIILSFRDAFGNISEVITLSEPITILGVVILHFQQPTFNFRTALTSPSNKYETKLAS